MPIIAQPSRLLRFALVLDAAASTSMGLMLATGSSSLAPFLGIPASVLLPIGLALLPFAAAVTFAASRRQPPRLLVQAIIALNALWVIESFAVLLLGWLQPTGLGVAFVLIQAAAVAGLAEAEWIGLRRSTTGEVAVTA
jgi:hypothetical protein